VTRASWLICAFLVAVVIALVWPAGVARRRLRKPRSGARWALSSVDLSVLESVARRRPRRLIAAVAASAGVVGWALGGPVAALVAAVYGALGARAWVRRLGNRLDAVGRARSLDELCALAADLRAGLPPAVAAELHAGPSLLADSVAPSVAAGALADQSAPGWRAGFLAGGRTDSPFRGSATGGVVAGGVVAGGAVAGLSRRAVHAELRLGELTAAVWRLAEHTGAPAADLIERIESDARAADRGKASAAAQAAGAQATALLLAALPVGGIALGYGIGADPLRVLLHTPLGAACAAGALFLQCAGLFWVDRLANGSVR
jgi:tight adherence protein B